MPWIGFTEREEIVAPWTFPYNRRAKAEENCQIVAKHIYRVNGKGVLVCTINENNWLWWSIYHFGASCRSAFGPINHPICRDLAHSVECVSLWHEICSHLVLGPKYYQSGTQKLEKLTKGLRLTPAERRRSPRIRLQIPIFVRGQDASGSAFLDLTKTFDISATGAFLASPRSMSVDSIIQLTIPAPPPIPSNYSRVPPETPPIQARIRRQNQDGDVQLIGVEFLKALE